MRRRNLPERRHCEGGALAMARMPSEHDLGPVEGFAEREAHAALSAMQRFLHHEHHDAPQPAAAPAVPHNETQEVPVSNVEALDEIADHVKAAARTFETVDRDLVVKAEAIKATQAGADAFEMLHALAQAEGAAPVLAVVGGILKGLAALAPQPASIASDVQPAPQPSGPVVAGQA